MMDMNKLMEKLNNKKRELVKNEKPVSAKLGTTRVVLLPGWDAKNPEVFWHEFGAHYIKDGSGKTVAYYPCDDVIYGKPCPVCQALAQAAQATSDEQTLEQIKQCRAGTQFLVNCIVIGENNNAPVVFALSKTAFEQLINVCGSWGMAVFDPQNPQIIEITRTGTGFDTKYMVSVSPEKFPLPADTMNKLKNLDEYVNQRSENLVNKSVMAISNLTGASLSVGYTPSPAPTPAPQISQMPVSTPQPAVAPVAPQQTYAQPTPTISHADIPSTGAPVPPVKMDAEMEDLLAGLDGL